MRQRTKPQEQRKLSLQTYNDLQSIRGQPELGVSPQSHVESQSQCECDQMLMSAQVDVCQWSSREYSIQSEPKKQNIKGDKAKTTNRSFQLSPLFS